MQGATKLNEIELKVLDEEVIKLHNIARVIEQHIGTGQLSEDVRNCADRLSDLLRKF